MLALFTRSWRRKAAIIAIVFYAVGVAAPAAAFALADSGTHCLPAVAAEQDAAPDHHGDAGAMADHDSHTAPAADDHGMTGKCCGTLCFTALAPHVAPIPVPLMQVSALSRLRVAHLFGLSAGPIDRPPRILLSI